MLACSAWLSRLAAVLLGCGSTAPLLAAHLLCVVATAAAELHGFGFIGADCQPPLLAVLLPHVQLGAARPLLRWPAGA